MIKVLAFCVAALCASQVQAQSVVGKWDCNARQSSKLDMVLLLDYRRNGTFYHRANVAGGDRRGRLDASLSVRGAWEQSGRLLLENVSKLQVKSLKLNNSDITHSPLGRQLSRVVSSRFSDNGTASIGRSQITFNGPNKMRLQEGKFKANCVKR